MPSRVAFGTAVTSIGYNAFDGCTGLQSIDFAEGLTTIEMYAFTGCTSLASVSLPDTLTTIKSSAFSGNALTEVEIPDSVTTIGSSVFLGCRSLASIDLGSGVETIGSYAFQDCVSLSSITFPSSLSSMGPRAFQGCTSLSDVMFLGKNLNQVAAMNSFNWGITDSRIIRAENQDPRETVFYGLYGTIESYLVEGSLDKNALATIGYWDSANSSWIKHPTYLKIGTAVTSIGEQAFQSCYNLVEVIVPSSVTAIGGYAFRFCGHL